MSINYSLPINHIFERVHLVNQFSYKKHLHETEAVRGSKTLTSQRHMNDKLSTTTWLRLMGQSLGGFRTDSPVKTVAVTLNAQPEATFES